MSAPQTSAPALPCVVQVGFAGSRWLFENPPADPDVERQWHDSVTQQVVKSLREIPSQLHLSPQHFLCGISQIACGADTVFARACRELQIPQRIFLPQTLADYLAATGSNGTPDFTPTQREEAKSLLASNHIIQQRVVSHSQDRTERFEETNFEILRVSDVVVCLLRIEADGKVGGTLHLLERARQRGTPVLEIRVGVRAGEPKFCKQWHLANAPQPIELPAELNQLPLPAIAKPGQLPSRDEFCEPLKTLASNQARWHQKLFRYAAVRIIATHFFATFMASVAVAFHKHLEHNQGLLGGLLALELLLLGIGFGVHEHLHRSHAAKVWAMSRVVAELARSLRAIGTRHVYLEHLFRLHLPFRFRYLLRTMNVLHLRSTWPLRDEPWKSLRDEYLWKRLDNPKDGQIAFYRQRLVEDGRRLKLYRGMFRLCTCLAILATATKLGLTIHVPVWLEPWEEIWKATLGTLAIVLPVLAVAGLSWSAALDCEARVETFRETLSFLTRQRPLLAQAESAAEYDKLLLETETVLLGETANWYSRRSNTGVT